MLDDARRTDEAEEARRASLMPRIGKDTSAGAAKDVTRVDGKPAPGLRTLVRLI